MKTLNLLFLTLSVAINISAQTPIIRYFNEFGKLVYKENALYYCKITKADTGNLYLGAEYWMDGHLRMVGQALDSEFDFKIGKATYYHKNGNKSMEGLYLSDTTTGLHYSFMNQKWECWHPNGKHSAVLYYKISDDFRSDTAYLMNSWDSSGMPEVIKGEGKYHFTDVVSTVDSNNQKITFEGLVNKGRFVGVWKGYYSNGKEYAEDTYINGTIARGVSFDRAGNKYTYEGKTETDASYPGGIDGLRLFLKMNLNIIGYDAISGSGVIHSWYPGVMIKAYVDFKGHIQHLEVADGLSPKYDEEAIRVAKTIKKIIPATLRGQPIDSYIYLPIDFSVGKL